MTSSHPQPSSTPPAIALQIPLAPSPDLALRGRRAVAAMAAAAATTQADLQHQQQQLTLSIPRDDSELPEGQHGGQRAFKSLSTLTVRFLHLLQRLGGVVDMAEVGIAPVMPQLGNPAVTAAIARWHLSPPAAACASQAEAELGATRRRLSDVINVLEGVGVLRRVTQGGGMSPRKLNVAAASGDEAAGHPAMGGAPLVVELADKSFSIDETIDMGTRLKALQEEVWRLDGSIHCVNQQAAQLSGSLRRALQYVPTRSSRLLPDPPEPCPFAIPPLPFLFTCQGRCGLWGLRVPRRARLAFFAGHPKPAHDTCISHRPEAGWAGR